MPTEWECDSCQLFFVTGWFHYHIFSSGYAAETNLVCRWCGTMHTLKHAITLTPRERDEMEVSASALPKKQLPDRMFAQREPLFVDLAERERAHLSDDEAISFADGRPRFPDWIEYGESRVFRPRRTVRSFATVEGCSDVLTLMNVRCHHCGELEGLVSDWSEDQGCPRCNGKMTIFNFWIT